MLKLIDSFKVIMRNFITKSLLIYEDIIDSKIINVQDLKKKYEDYDIQDDYLNKALSIKRKVSRIVTLSGGYYSNEEEDELAESYIASENEVDLQDNPDQKMTKVQFQEIQKRLSTKSRNRRRNSIVKNKNWLNQSTFKTMTTSLSEADRIGNI